MPVPRTFGRDTGLQARMLLTLFLLGLVYAVLVGVLFAAGAGAVTVAVIAGACSWSSSSPRTRSRCSRWARAR